MKIALAQVEVLPNQPKKNLETMLRMIEEAKQQNVDLIAFPELCLGGYLVGDLFLRDAYCRDLMEYHEEILKASKGIAIAYGNIYLDEGANGRLGDDKLHPNKDGRTRKYNAVYVVQDGKPVRRKDEHNLLPEGVHAKGLLPNYRFFDDERYFFSLEDVAKDAGVPLEKLAQPYMIKVDGKEVPVGFEVCEDLWCEDYRRDGEAQNVTKMLIDNGAQMIVNISCSPWTYGKNNARDRRVEFLKKDSGDSFVPFLYVNNTGAQNNGKNIVVFDGGSTVYNKDGKPIQFAKEMFREDLMIVDSFGLPSKERQEQPAIAQKLEALLTGIRHVRDMSGNTNDPKYVIGLSGGMDSSVVAALLSLAVGPERIIGVNMPTKYNKEKTKNAAMHLAQKLGIYYKEVPIQELVDVNQRIIDESDLLGNGWKPADAQQQLNEENTQAKIRGTSLLSNFAAKYGALFTNNGNKLEIALGYATLYGDVGGAIAPIADLTKTEVVELARYLNTEIFHDEVIPNSLLPDHLFRFGADQIKPSAELKKDQEDPMRFGYHCALLSKMTDFKKIMSADVMRWYVDGTMEKNLGISTDMLKRWNIDEPKTFIEDLQWFENNVERNVFKRIQGPPIIIISKSAYGFDIRESQLPHNPTREEERLKERILKMEKYVTA